MSSVGIYNQANWRHSMAGPLRGQGERGWNLGLALTRKQPFVTLSNKHPYLRH